MLRRAGAVLLMGIVAFVPTGCGDSSARRPEGESFEKQVAKVRNERQPDLRAKKLIQIAVEQAKADDEFGAEETLKLAAKACAAVQDPVARVQVFAWLAEIEQRLGNRSEARNAAEFARLAAEEVEPVEIKIRSLARAGRAQGVIGNTEGAVETLKQAETLAGHVEELHTKTLVIVAVTASYQKIGRQADADRMIGAALPLAETIQDPRQRSEALAGVAACQHLMEKPGAAETFDLALEAARKINKPHSLAFALAEIAEKLFKAGDHAKTRQVLQEAESVASKIPDPAIQRETLGKIRRLMGKAPNPVAR